MSSSNDQTSLVMSPAIANTASTKVVKLVPNRTDYQLWLESTMNQLSIQGLIYYIDTPGFGGSLDMQAASKEKVLCAQNMSKCFQIIWNTLDRSIQCRNNFQSLNEVGRERIPRDLLKCCEVFKHSKSESSLLWAKLSTSPEDPKKLAAWLEDYQYNFSRYQALNQKSLEVDQALVLWAKSKNHKIRNIAREIQDEKLKLQTTSIGLYSC